MKGEYMEKFVQDLQGAIQAKRNLCDSTVDEQKAGTPEGYILHGMEIALCMAKERLCENNQECGGERERRREREKEKERKRERERDGTTRE